MSEDDSHPAGTLPERRTMTTPVPDPTVLTTDQLNRAVAHERDYVRGQVAVLEERLLGIDRATELRLSGIEGIPGQIDEKVVHLSAVMTERFNVMAERFESVGKQFNERDIRTQQQQEASGAALAAALQAAKELVGAQGEASAAAAVKSETSFTKQIDQIGTIIQTLEKALDARITELKERIDRGEGNTQGVVDQRGVQTTERQQSSANQNILIGVGGLVLTIIIVVLAVIAASPS
jgi:hypothetical protein